VPDPERHKVFMDIEPYTGKIFRGRNRLQVNFWISPRRCNGSIAFGEEKLPTTWWPYIFVDEAGEATKPQLEEFLQIVKFIESIRTAGVALVVVGVLGFIVLIASYFSPFDLFTLCKSPELASQIKVQTKPAEEISVVPSAAKSPAKGAW